MQIFSYGDIVGNFSRNKLRAFPAKNKGKERLLPYARPVISPGTSIAQNAEYFVAGNCYGRQIERALRIAGCTITSSPEDLSLPGTVLQQYNRYNVYHQDVATNEIAWAIDPNVQPIDDALIEVDGDWVDMQLNFSFAHAEEDAKRFRRTFNSTYRKVRTADVIVVTTGGIEIWYDAEKGLYLNSMPTKRMVDLYPDRFELHRFDLQKCEESLHRTVETILSNSDKSPVIFITASPVFQPTVYGPGDSLIDQTYARCCQRVAAERVAAAYPQVEYLPGMEFADLSDRKFGFSDFSYNHTLPCMSNRLTAEMLERYVGKSVGQTLLYALGHGEALNLAGEHESAQSLCEMAMNQGADPLALAAVYSTALRSQFLGSRAAAWLSERFADKVDATDQAKLIAVAKPILLAYGTVGQLRSAIDAITRWASTEESVQRAEAEMTDLLDSGRANRAGNHRGEVADVAVMFAAAKYDAVIDRCCMLFQSDATPSAKSELLKILDKVFYLKGKRDFLPFLIQAVRDDAALEPVWKTKLMQTARGVKDAALIREVLALSDRLADVAGHRDFVQFMTTSLHALDESTSVSRA
jgi:hypothetical protein